MDAIFNLAAGLITNWINMNKILITIFIFMSFFSFDSSARQNHRPTNNTKIIWEREPESFVGIKFGISLLDQMPECPKSAHGFYDPFKTDSMCSQVLSTTFAKIHNAPMLGFAYEITAMLYEGKFEGAVILFQHKDYEKLMELFLEKYGKPMSVENNSYSTRGGMKFNGATSTWTGSYLLIKIDEYSSNIEEGSVYISTKVNENSINKSNDEKLLKFKENL